MDAASDQGYSLPALPSLKNGRYHAFLYKYQMVKETNEITQWKMIVNVAITPEFFNFQGGEIDSKESIPQACVGTTTLFLLGS